VGEHRVLRSEIAELVADVRELIALRALYDVVQDQHGAIVARLEDKHVLVLALFVMEDLVDF
jgi:hypothetical protein